MSDRSTARRTSPWLLLPLPLLLGGLWSCPRDTPDPVTQPGRMALHAVRVTDRNPQQGRRLGIRPEVLTKRVRQVLARSTHFQLLPARRAGSYQLTMELAITAQIEDSPVPGPVLAGMATLQGETTTAATLRADAALSLLKMMDAEQVRVKAELLLDLLLDQLTYQASLLRGTPAALVKALRQKDRARLKVAVEIAAHRRCTETFDPLVKLLRHGDQTVADRAIGALVALGDARAVYYLTRVAAPRDTAMLAKILDAVGALGGEEALQYLTYVATGHDDEDIRNMASEAMERMGRKNSSDPSNQDRAMNKSVTRRR